MTLTALREDALSSSPGGFVLRLGLPWIRSMPLASLTRLEVSIDELRLPVDIEVGKQTVTPDALIDEPNWWFLQDRLRLIGHRPLADGAHDVAVSFVLVVPYLQAAPGAPLALHFPLRRSLTLDAPPLAATVSLDVA